MNCLYKKEVCQNTSSYKVVYNTSPKAVNEDVNVDIDINEEYHNTTPARPCVKLLKNDTLQHHFNPNQCNYMRSKLPLVKPIISGKVLYTTNTGGILKINNNVIKWFDKSSCSSNSIKDIISGHMIASSQRDKKGCIDVGHLMEGIYKDNPVMFYTMPCAKMDLLDWLDIYNDVSEYEWAKNFASVLSIFVAVITHVHEMHNMGNRVLHTDIKPENIALITDIQLTPYHQQLEDVIKIIDLDGCVEYDNSLIKLNTPVGTKAYLAPEMRKTKNKNNSDCHGYPCGTFTDAWLLGMLLLVLINRNVFFIDSDESDKSDASDDNCSTKGNRVSKDHATLLAIDIANANKFIDTYDIPNVNKTAIKKMLKGFLDPNYNSRMTLDELIST